MAKTADEKKGGEDAHNHASKGIPQSAKKEGWSNERYEAYVAAYKAYIKNNYPKNKTIEEHQDHLRGYNTGYVAASRGTTRRGKKLGKWSDAYWDAYQEGYTAYSTSHVKNQAEKKKREEKTKEKNASYREKISPHQQGKIRGTDAASKGQKKLSACPEGKTEEWYQGYLEAYDNYCEKHQVDEIAQLTFQGKQTAGEDFARGRNKTEWPENWPETKWLAYQQHIQELKEQHPDRDPKLQNTYFIGNYSALTGRALKTENDFASQDEFDAYMSGREAALARNEIGEEELEYRNGRVKAQMDLQNALTPKTDQPEGWSDAKWAGYQDLIKTTPIDKEKQQERSGKKLARMNYDQGVLGLSFIAEQTWPDKKIEAYQSTQEHLLNKYGKNKLVDNKLTTTANDLLRRGRGPERVLNNISNPKEQIEFLEKYDSLKKEKNLTKEEFERLKGKRKAQEHIASGAPLKKQKPKTWSLQEWQAYKESYKVIVQKRNLTSEDLDYRKGKRQGGEDARAGKEERTFNNTEVSPSFVEGYRDGFATASSRKSNEEANKKMLNYSEQPPLVRLTK